MKPELLEWPSFEVSPEVMLVLGIMAVVLAGLYFIVPPGWIEEYWDNERNHPWKPE